MFFFPLYDDNPCRITPFVTWAMIGLCAMIFLWQMGLSDEAGEQAVLALGFVPATFLGDARLAPDLALVPPAATLVTSMFLHGGLMHLGGNMLYLWIFGNNVEDAMGSGRFLLFYLLCGIAAALAQGLADPDSTVPMIGASGAIAGILGAYLLLHPRANVRVLLVIIIYVRFVNIPAVFVLGAWFALQIWSSLSAPAGAGGVAFLAHVGGFVAGLILIPFFRLPGVPLWGQAASPSFEVSRRPPSLPPRGPWRRGPWG
ncbi:MAG: rhomboid family intramembrane serine protease [Rhodospirillales bacterium]|nr:rhomboid family intramembrane serine protease [Rhodospirillales bacterium]